MFASLFSFSLNFLNMSGTAAIMQPSMTPANTMR